MWHEQPTSLPRPRQLALFAVFLFLIKFDKSVVFSLKFPAKFRDKPGQDEASPVGPGNSINHCQYQPRKRGEEILLCGSEPVPISPLVPSCQNI